jgi:NAD(P)-dependent dehydrogenase (short-subunit alcohol dehydrogenase family)
MLTDSGSHKTSSAYRSGQQKSLVRHSTTAIDVRDVDELNKIVGEIGEHGRMDGLVAAAGIQQETPALDYTAKDANLMFEINITGVFMTAKQSRNK